jgi:hypothetical protein
VFEGLRRIKKERGLEAIQEETLENYIASCTVADIIASKHA